ncbi:MAG: DNA alkylation repair protein [Spirochaetota bacterium]
MVGLSSEFQFRDVFHKGNVNLLAREITRNYPGFAKAKFIKDSLHNREALGFLERSNQICAALRSYLPDDFPHACQILIDSLGKPLTEPGKTVWDAFIIMPQTAFVARYGKDHYDLSMRALYEMTQRFSAEGDLRTFLELDYKKTMQLLQKWAKDPSPHVRRLVSEGTRPRLPLAGRIQRFVDDPKPLVKLLELLKDDPSLYVRRSVANNFNDIAKDNPEVVVATFQKWNQGAGKDRLWLIRHALRSLVKQGHPGAMQILGVNTSAKAKVTGLMIEDKKVTIGENLEVSFSLQCLEREETKFIVDYQIDFVKARNKRAKKVFKLKNVTLQPKEKKEITFVFKARNTSGRKLYPGRHGLEILVNGNVMAGSSWELLH